METENSQKLYSVSKTHNSKIRELSDGNRVIVCQTNFLLWVPLFLSYELWKQRIELSKNLIQTGSYPSDIYSILKYVSFSPRTGFKPQLTVRKPINSPVLSPTLLQIYCIRSIGLIPQFFWVWATTCDPTKGNVKLIINNF